MVWAKAALVGGIVLVCAAFAVGAEQQSSAVVEDQSYICGPSISASWLVSGTPDLMSPGPATSADSRPGVVECRAILNRSRVLVVTSIGVGGVLALIGWTGVSRRRESSSPPAKLVHAGEP